MLLLPCALSCPNFNLNEQWLWPMYCHTTSSLAISACVLREWIAVETDQGKRSAGNCRRLDRSRFAYLICESCSALPPCCLMRPPGREASRLATPCVPSALHPHIHYADRHPKRQCSHGKEPHSCSYHGAMNECDGRTEGEAYEDRHVHQVYEQIASHFSSTRYKVIRIYPPPKQATQVADRPALAHHRALPPGSPSRLRRP